jgi:hypothetical protein
VLWMTVIWGLFGCWSLLMIHTNVPFFFFLSSCTFKRIPRTCDECLRNQPLQVGSRRPNLEARLRSYREFRLLQQNIFVQT